MWQPDPWNDGLGELASDRDFTEFLEHTTFDSISREVDLRHGSLAELMALHSDLKAADEQLRRRRRRVAERIRTRTRLTRKKAHDRRTD